MVEETRMFDIEPASMRENDRLCVRVEIIEALEGNGTFQEI
jgi:hypothetical protein